MDVRGSLRGGERAARRRTRFSHLSGQEQSGAFRARRQGNRPRRRGLAAEQTTSARAVGGSFASTARAVPIAVTTSMNFIPLDTV